MTTPTTRKTESLSNKKLIGNILSYAALVLLAFFFMFPLVFMFMTAFKNNDPGDSSGTPSELRLLQDLNSAAAFIPNENMGVDQFNDVFGRFSAESGNTEFWRIFFNSSLVVALIVILGLVVNSSFAYALARMQFVGRNLLITLVVSLIIIPFQAVAIPMMLLTYRLNLANSYPGLIIPFVASAFSVYLFYQFFIALPKELEEAAFVDGASRFRIYWSIMLPLSGPVFATVAVLQFLAQWGNLLWPVMIVQDPQLFTLPLAMQNFFGQAPRQWGDIMAFTVMATTPTLLLFLFFQRWFVRSAVSSGVKG
jgi:multiple sugar transport system permease protein